MSPCGHREGMRKDTWVFSGSQEFVRCDGYGGSGDCYVLSFEFRATGFGDEGTGFRVKG